MPSATASRFSKHTWRRSRGGADDADADATGAAAGGRGAVAVSPKSSAAEAENPGSPRSSSAAAVVKAASVLPSLPREAARLLADVRPLFAAAARFRAVLRWEDPALSALVLLAFLLACALVNPDYLLSVHALAAAAVAVFAAGWYRARMAGAMREVLSAEDPASASEGHVLGADGRGEPLPSSPAPSTSFVALGASLAQLAAGLWEFSERADRVRGIVLWRDPEETARVLRFVVFILYPLTFAAVRVIPARPLAAVAGTALLVWHSPAAALARARLAESRLARESAAALRRSALGRHVGLVPPLSPSSRAGGGGPSGRQTPRNAAAAAAATLSATLPAAGKRARGCAACGRPEPRTPAMAQEFVVFENQRWWPGLDWVPMTLPRERPAWTDEDQNPSPEPSAFAFPPVPSDVAAPAAAAGRSPPDAPRTLVWRWADPAWRVAAAPSSKLFSRGPAGSAAAAAWRSRRWRPELPRLPPPPQYDELEDPEGWEYSDGLWRHPLPGPTSRSVLFGRLAEKFRVTRRRRWARTAGVYAAGTCECHLEG